MWGLECRVWRLEFRVSGLGLRVQGGMKGFRGTRGQGFGFTACRGVRFRGLNVSV